MHTCQAIIPVWDALQLRFHKTAKELAEEELPLRIGPASIGYMLRHNAEVEYMFAEWFFEQPMPADLKLLTSRGAAASEHAFTNHQELMQLLEASYTHLVEGMNCLSEEAWHEPKNSPMGPSTPIEAIGRLMYHTGIHAGQISLIRKHAERAVESES